MLRGWIPILTKGIEITFFAIIGRPIGKDIKKNKQNKNYLQNAEESLYISDVLP